MTRHIHGPDDEWCEECFGEADAPTETSDTQKENHDQQVVGSRVRHSAADNYR